MLDEIPGLCPGFQKGYTYAEKMSDHSSSDRCVEIEITKVETKTGAAKGSKSRRRLYPTANLIGSGHRMQ